LRAILEKKFFLDFDEIFLNSSWNLQKEKMSADNAIVVSIFGAKKCFNDFLGT